MASGRKVKVKNTKRNRAAGAKRNTDALVAHRSFAPLIGLWGAALGGGVVMALPYAMVEAATAGTLMGTFDVPTQPTLAGGLALVLGTVLFAAAAVKSAAALRRIRPTSIINKLARRVRPIDPFRDLGTRSLDDPIETMPFATPAWRDADLTAPQPEPEPQAVPRFMSQPIPDLAPPARETAPSFTMPEAAPFESVPQALDLAQFAELPGRNAVWVEEAPALQPAAAPAFVPLRQVASPVQEPSRPVFPSPSPSPSASPSAASPPLPGTAALTRLRTMPASELSMAEMVERFAGALHEHRASTPKRDLGATELAAREAALAEALKALATLSGLGARPLSVNEDEPLRAALTQLHPRRGVG